MDDMAEQFARRDRYRRTLAWAKTPEQRMAECFERQALAAQRMRQNPEGYAWFLRRNYKTRASHLPKPDGK
jgi:hypothetical protein